MNDPTNDTEQTPRDFGSVDDENDYTARKRREAERAEWLNRRAACGCLGGCPDCEPEARDGEE